MDRHSMDNLPWYRQFWPWFLFGLPGVVVVAGLSTWWIAAHNADSVVVDDYYKEGLAINRELSRQRRAETLNMRAVVSYGDRAVEVELSGDDRPAALLLKLSHPLDAHLDQDLKLPRVAAGRYRSPASLPAVARWHWQLEPLGAPEDASWRLDGDLGTISVDAR